MSSSQSSRSHAYGSSHHHYYQQHYHAHVYMAQASQATAAWMNVIPIEDDDLTFGGRPLSDLHEEDRRRYSSEGPEAPEQRGRTRNRGSYESSSSSSGSSSGHKHKHHHKKSDKK